MPYRDEKDEGLPMAVKRLPAEARRIWVETFNAVYSDVGEDIKAYAIAWARVKALYEQDSDGGWHRKEAAKSPVVATAGRGQVVGLAVPFGEYSLEESPSVEFLKTGTFVDMWGQEVVIDRDVLDGLVANFDAGTAEQHVPIDVDHEFAEAAGWIRSVFRDGEKLLMDPVWTDLGKELVASKRYKYVSAAMNLDEQALVAVSLVNFPAVKGLKPVELSEREPGKIVDHVFAGPTSVVEMYVQAPSQSGEAAPKPSARKAPTEGQAASQTSLGDRIMPENQIAPVAAPEIVAPPAPATPAPPPAKPESPQVLQQLAQLDPEAMGLLTKEQKVTIEKAVQAQLQAIREEQTRMVQEELSRMLDHATITQFAAKVCTQGPAVLPWQAERVVELLSEMPAAHRVRVIDLLTDIHDNGLVPLTELGTSEGGKKKLALETWMVQAAKTANVSMEQFLEINGYDKDRYDLAAS